MAMGYGISHFMGYGLEIPAYQVGGLKKPWGIRGYGLYPLWVKRGSTVSISKPDMVTEQTLSDSLLCSTPVLDDAGRLFTRNDSETRLVLPLLHGVLTSVTGRKVRDVMLRNVVNFGQEKGKTDYIYACPRLTSRLHPMEET
jgi:hypothetical protein